MSTPSSRAEPGGSRARSRPSPKLQCKKSKPLIRLTDFRNGQLLYCLQPWLGQTEPEGAFLNLGVHRIMHNGLIEPCVANPVEPYCYQLHGHKNTTENAISILDQ